MLLEKLSRATRLKGSLTAVFRYLHGEAVLDNRQHFHLPEEDVMRVNGLTFKLDKYKTETRHNFNCEEKKNHWNR